MSQPRNGSDGAPVFHGKCWDYEDARRRVPHAWRERPVSKFPKHEYAPGHPESVNNWRVVGTVEVSNGWEDVAPKGLGHFERSPGSPAWVWIQPNGYAHPVGENYGQDTAPPLPQAGPYARRRCGCSKGEHVCGSCGGPWWIEVHGMADGYCTNCYRRG